MDALAHVTRAMAKYPGMKPALDRPAGRPEYRAFDIDPEGRVLAGSDESGSTQLTEIRPTAASRR